MNISKGEGSMKGMEVSENSHWRKPTKAVDRILKRAVGDRVERCNEVGFEQSEVLLLCCILVHAVFPRVK
jgi:hypothetical protein